MWHGDIVNIPVGWALCDGGNGTPDLREKFIIGTTELADGTVGTRPINSTGGSTDTSPATLSIAQLAAHTHTYTAPGGLGNQENGSGASAVESTGGSTTGSTGSGATHTHTGTLPPYYALAYIMRLAEGAVAV